MNRVSGIMMIAPAMVLAFCQTNASAQTRDRSQVPIEDKWKLEDLYPSDQAWEQARQDLAARFDEVTRYKGKLTTSASELLACMEFDSLVSKEFGRLFSYASMKSDEDTRNSKHLGMKQQMQ